MRYYCAKCYRRRDEKFMKSSPITTEHFCYRDISVTGFKEPSCYDGHIVQERKRVLREAKVLKMYVLVDKITEGEMSAGVDKNQTDIITQIKNNGK